MWITVNLYGSGDPVLFNLAEVMRVQPIQLEEPPKDEPPFFQARLFTRDDNQYDSAAAYEAIKRQISGLSQWIELTSADDEHIELVNLDLVKRITPNGEGAVLFTDVLAIDRGYLIDFSLISTNLSAPVAGEDALGNKI